MSNAISRDLAKLYEVDTGQLTRQVKRNIDRFPEDFMFQLTKEELRNLMCQIGTSSWGGTRKLPHAFTEQGVAMLSGVLHIFIVFEAIKQLVGSLPKKEEKAIGFHETVRVFSLAISQKLNYNTYIWQT